MHRIREDIDILACDINAALVHLHSHSQFYAFKRPLMSSSHDTLYEEQLLDIMFCDPH